MESVTSPGEKLTMSGISPAGRPGQIRSRQSPGAPEPLVTIGVLTFGDYPRLARRCLDSILRCCAGEPYRLVVGANAVGAETSRYLSRLARAGEVDRLCASP